ncbi:ubiquitin carboxyl-terminal hydrolase 40 isoform X2 [Hyperolius riggenbachi]|uniref:ubiquitin carboxyl-terminal hydrolase 40 isoform X2 n=1 Tax=Hyperolius riggenbachi TaxID=752182 RepID=UPI0035A36D32
MFGDLFEEEEDFSFLSNSTTSNGRRSKPKDGEVLEPRGDTRLSGLRNQGGTCYLNSLLQTLLFTPEFREAIFALSTEELGSLEDKDEADNKVRIIPLQLQRLFAQLLLVDQQAASTTDLTSSFGWDNNEEVGQHDVQELNRILFSALESSLEGTSGHDFIKNLYHGTVVNQIKCQECGYVSERQEDFLDLTVAVKDMCSLEDSLCSMYVEEEIFDGDNLYRCGACDNLVPAAKSAKLGKLPPFLTLSLLRFNFDFTKCERYKEMSRYTFPTRLNIRPFCEQQDLEDIEYMYELFSVIIHKGGCYGGHYHAYIRDLDELGHWGCQEEKKKMHATENTVNEQECPAVTLAAVLAETGADKMLPVDQLSQKLLEHTGSSWNKVYRKQHGALRKFMQSHPSIFQLSSDGSMVGLACSENGTDPQCCKPSTGGKTQPAQRGTSQWFDFNDSSIQCIQEREIEKQFQGKESAYMLFYRKSKLHRPQEAKGNARFGIPEYLQRQMETVNEELQKKRNEADTETNRINLHLHLSSGYRFENGALHPVVSLRDSTLEISVDRRGTVADLRNTVFQLLDEALEGSVLSVAKFLPAGLHIFEDLSEAEQTLARAGIKDGSDVFVWDGKQVGGQPVKSGPDCTPVLLTIMRPRKFQNNGSIPAYAESEKVFPSNLQLREVQERLAGSPSLESLLCSPSTENSEGWSVFASEDMGKTLTMLGIKDGSSLLLLDSHEEGEMTLATEKKSAEDSGFYCIQVQDWCRTREEKQTVQLPADPSSTMACIRQKAFELLGLDEEIGDTCMRPVHRSGKLLSPVLEHITVQDAEFKPGSVLALCRGRAPAATEVFLSFVLSTDLQEGQEQDIIMEETQTVKECLQQMLEKVGLPGEAGWHLRKMDWCYEAGDPLTEEDSSLKELNIGSGDTFVITEGRLPPKGFLKLPIWLYSVKIQEISLNHINNHLTASQISPIEDGCSPDESDSDFSFVGHIEISKNAFLQELKLQVLTLPLFDAIGIPSPDFLRIWTLENKRLAKVLRDDHMKISDYKLGIRTTLCAEPLQAEEILSHQDLLLRVQLSVPGERRYFPPVDIAWDVSHGCTASALRQRIANHYSLPADKVEIAKYFPEKHEWLPISSWTQQVSKKKKKKKKIESLQGAPYHLKDGDIIGVKNLLLDDRIDFSSENDCIAKENQRKLAESKTNGSQSNCNEKVRPKVRKPETALSIRVGVFR